MFLLYINIEGREKPVGKADFYRFRAHPRAGLSQTNIFLHPLWPDPKKGLFSDGKIAKISARQTLLALKSTKKYLIRLSQTYLGVWGFIPSALKHPP